MKKLSMLFIIVVILISGCKKTEEVENQVDKTEVTLKATQSEVEAIVLKTDMFSKELSANGKVSALRKVDIRTKLNEPVLKVNVETGQRVKPGQLIAIMDTFELFHAYLRQKVTYERAMFEFSDKLVGLGYTEENIEYMPEEQRKNAEMQSGIALAETDFTIARNKYKSAFVRAPLEGVIADMTLKEGNYPENGYICSIVDNRKLKVDFFVLEEESMLVSENLKVEISPFYNESIKETGTITGINPRVDNGLIRVSAELDTYNSVLYDGVTVKVFVKSAPKECLAVPKTAIVLRTGKKVVFTFNSGEQVAKWNYVETGEENSSHIVITKGLNEMDTVIVSGNLHLGNDVPCRISSLE